MQTVTLGAAKALGSIAVLSSLLVAHATDESPANPAPALTIAKPALTLEGAQRALDAAIEKARALGTTGSIAIVDGGGALLAFARLNDSFAGSWEVAIGKARTAALFQKPTASFEEIIRKGRTPMLALDDFTPLQGGLPLRVADHVVGGVGVSGAASAEQDEELAMVAAAAIAALRVDRKP